MKTLKKDLLKVNIYGSRAEMGRGAAKDIAACILSVLETKPRINIIFAAAPSQNEMLACLAADKSIPWKRINAYHMDEYIGLPADAPQGFGNFLRRAIFDRVPFGSVNYIDPAAPDAEAEAERYGALINENPPDIIVMGIGENGHIAFNDPPVADFNDKKTAKVVSLDEICRNQQVHDGCFSLIEDVPKQAVTLTVPVFSRAPRLFCVVPAPTKAEAVYKTLNGPAGECCPATVMRSHPCATLYLDPDSASLLEL